MKETGTSLTAVVETVLSGEGMIVSLGINKLGHAIRVGKGSLGMMKDFEEKTSHGSWGSYLTHRGKRLIAEMKSVATQTKVICTLKLPRAGISFRCDYFHI